MEERRWELARGERCEEGVLRERKKGFWCGRLGGRGAKCLGGGPGDLSGEKMAPLREAWACGASLGRSQGSGKELVEGLGEGWARRMCGPAGEWRGRR